MVCLHCLHHEVCDAVSRSRGLEERWQRKRCLPEKRLSATFPATGRALSLPSRKRAASPPHPVMSCGFMAGPWVVKGSTATRSPQPRELGPKPIKLSPDGASTVTET